MNLISPHIAKVVRDEAPTAERNGALSQNVLSHIYHEGLFKLLLPESFNGKNTGLPKAILFFEEAAYIDGSFGWLVTIGTGGNYFAPLFQNETAQALFGPQHAVVAGSGYPTGKATPVQGGYHITGSWRYCSGADYATVFTANCILPDGSIKSFAFSPEQVSINPNWQAHGLKATTGHTISVTDVFVPESKSFEISTGKRHFEEPVFNYPFLQFAETSFTAVNIGICQNFFAEATIAAEQYNTDENPIRYKYVSQLIQQQKALLNTAAEKFHETIERSWEALLHNNTIPEKLLNDVSQQSKQTVTTALTAAQQVYPYLGLQAAMENTTLNRCWRDLHTASQHILLKSFE